jgi:EAL and modified HD-GYP domain-containing signal transduction protein
MEDIFVARQPIYNRQLDLVGYELLYRANEQCRAEFDDGAQASSRLIINTFMDFGLENIVGSNPAFINLTHDFFINEQPIPMNREQVVLEVNEKVLPAKHVLDGLEDLAQKGYTIALDDFVYKPELEPLLKLARIVKIDLGVLGREGIAEQAEICRKYDVKLLAEKVESPSDLEYCKELGFDYFQGFFFCKPQLVRSKSQPANRSVILQILNKLEDESADVAELEKVIIQDVALTYKLLRYLNCATYAMRREISTVREALMLIGTSQVKKWAILLLMSSYDNDKPEELIATAMVRARMCELLAGKNTRKFDPDQAFTIGLFSTLDAVMDSPMEELLDTISLNSRIKFALLNHEGDLGHLLKQTLRYEKGEWSELEINGFTATDYAMAYLSAVQWANENFNLMVNQAPATVAQ